MSEVERPEIGIYDRVRVDIPGYPGALAESSVGSVLDAPPPPGTPWRIEEPPVVDAFFAEEAVEALAIAPWTAAGARGQGVKVAVFDVQWFNAEVVSDELGAVETHDCEGTRSCDVPMDTLRPRYSWEEGSHGVACAEVIRDLAPEVELHLVRVNGLTTFENAVEWAARNEIDLVSMSMSFFNNSFHDGTGPINDAADRLAESDVLLVNSAGNYAGEHWQGDWRDLDHDRAMDFPWGSEYLPLYFGPGGYTVYVSWDEFAACGRNDFDATVFDDDGDVVGRGERTQDAEADTCSPVERFTVNAAEEDWYYLRIERVAGAGDVRIGVHARSGTAYDAQPGSLADPASSPSAFTVGAVRADGYAHNGAESFSSEGPSRGGSPKPDIAGPDGLSSRIYGPTGFYGTSASTPAVAGALAVLMSAHPDWTAREAANQLAANALDGRTVWAEPDGELGAGRARLWDFGAESAGVCGGGGATIGLPLLWLWGFRRRGACPP